MAEKVKISIPVHFMIYSQACISFICDDDSLIPDLCPLSNFESEATERYLLRLCLKLFRPRSKLHAQKITNLG